MHYIGHLGCKLKSLISGSFSHSLNTFLSSFFLFSFVTSLLCHCFFLSFLGGCFHLISCLSLTLYLIIINTALFFVFFKSPWTKYLFLSLVMLVIVVLKFSFTLHCLCFLGFFDCVLFWFLILHILKCLEMISLLLTFTTETLKADWEMFIAELVLWWASVLGDHLGRSQLIYNIDCQL